MCVFVRCLDVCIVHAASPVYIRYLHGVHKLLTKEYAVKCSVCICAMFEDYIVDVSSTRERLTSVRNIVVDDALGKD